MFGNLMGGLINTEQITHDTIQSTLENVAEELKCSFKDFSIMIRPINADFEMKFYIFRTEAGKPPVYVREIILKEILSNG
jgi:hypothetical protein